MYRNIIYSLLCVLTLGSCVPFFNQPLTEQRAEIGAETPVKKTLENLPKPQMKLTAAVYSFRDQTGQYKPSTTGASWSSAVTQGTTSILIKALEDSDWFYVAEREGLSNLSSERNIILNTQKKFSSSNDKKNYLRPLLFAGIILEGGIISYDANVITGGAGLRYFSAGGSAQYRQDRVTVYLRAVSTMTGKVMKTVHTSKMILSQKIDASIFRFVKFKRLLEAESGITYNEPSEMAVKEAIEKAVESLIIEGVIDGIWKLRNPEDINSDVIRNYIEEKDSNRESDFFDQMMTKRRHKFGMGVFGGSWLYQGDYKDPELRPMGGLSLLFDTQSFVQFSAQFSKSSLATSQKLDKTFNALEVGLKYRLMPSKNWTPYIEGGIGLMAHNKSKYFINFSNSVYTQAVYGAGVEFLLNDRFGLNISLLNHYSLSDNVDGLKQGRFNDYFWEAKVGLNFYLDRIWGKKKKKRKELIRKKGTALDFNFTPNTTVVPNGNIPSGESVESKKSLKRKLRKAQRRNKKAEKKRKRETKVSVDKKADENVVTPNKNQGDKKNEKIIEQKSPKSQKALERKAKREAKALKKQKQKAAKALRKKNEKEAKDLKRRWNEMQKERKKAEKEKKRKEKARKK